MKNKNIYIFAWLLLKEDHEALRGSRRHCPHLSSADHEGSGTNCVEIYARDLERMSCKEQEQWSFPSKNITWTPNEHGMISFCEQTSNEKNFQLISTYIYRYWYQLLVIYLLCGDFFRENFRWSENLECCFILQDNFLA